jgi:hypothetical protein
VIHLKASGCGCDNPHSFMGKFKDAYEYISKFKSQSDYCGICCDLLVVNNVVDKIQNGLLGKNFNFSIKTKSNFNAFQLTFVAETTDKRLPAFKGVEIKYFAMVKANDNISDRVSLLIQDEDNDKFNRFSNDNELSDVWGNPDKSKEIEKIILNKIKEIL